MKGTLAKGLILYLALPYFKLVLSDALLVMSAIYVCLVAIPTTLGWMKAIFQKRAISRLK